jgi:hypothetical protein
MDGEAEAGVEREIAFLPLICADERRSGDRPRMNANGHDEYAALPDRMIAVIMGIEKPKHGRRRLEGNRDPSGAKTACSGLRKKCLS